jgi:hypothetical protein
MSIRVDIESSLKVITKRLRGAAEVLAEARATIDHVAEKPEVDQTTKESLATLDDGIEGISSVLHLLTEEMFLLGVARELMRSKILAAYKPPTKKIQVQLPKKKARI